MGTDPLSSDIFVDDDLIRELVHESLCNEAVRELVGPVRQRPEVHGRIDLAGFVVVSPAIVLDMPLDVRTPIAPIDRSHKLVFFILGEEVLYVHEARNIRLLDTRAERR